MSSPQTESKSKIETKNDSKSGSKSSQKNREPTQTATGKEANLSLPVNRLEELDLNNCAVEIKDLKFTYNKAAGYLLDNFTMTFPRSAMYALFVH